MLVELGSVEVGEAHLVRGKVRGHPVEDDSDARLVELIDQVHEILRRAVAAGGGEIPCRLVAPGAVEGVFHHRQELDVGEAQPPQVLAERRGQLAIGERPVALLRHPAPGTDVHLVDGDGRLQRVARRPLLHPFRIAPAVGEVPDYRGRARRLLGAEGERVGLVDAVSVARLDVELVCGAGADALGAALPDP